MAGMILNGLGLANRPWSLTPQFVARTPLAVLCRAGMGAELCNRFPLGRTREAAYTDGGDLLFQELALAVCAHEGIDRRCHPLDPTRVSRRGADVPDRDEHAMTITHGDSREHRPDLKQAVLERMVSPDGGAPCCANVGTARPRTPRLSRSGRRRCGPPARTRPAHGICSQTRHATTTTRPPPAPTWASSHVFPTPWAPSPR